MRTKNITPVFSEPFELGFRAGYWGRDFNLYTSLDNRQAFELGKDWGRYAAEMPGEKGRQHMRVAQKIIYGLLYLFMGDNSQAGLN